jgi:hypothetical protein
VLLSFKRFGASMPAIEDASMVSLLDIAPTILAYLSLPPLQSAQGISLANSLSGIKHGDNKISRALFLESGDSISEIETDHIFIEKVVKREIGIYQVNTKNGLLSIKPLAAASMIKNKQHAVIQGDWLLAHYPQQNKTRLAPSANNQSELVFDNYVLPDYYLLMNLKTRQWTIGLDSRFAQNAPTKKLLQQLQDFNRGEI